VTNMQADSHPQASSSHYASGPVTKAPNWHALVAWDTMFNGMATGLFVVASVGELARPDIFTHVVTLAYPAALLLLFADLTCLVLDLGDPLRFHHMLRVFKPSSPMSLGVWCITIFSLFATAVALLTLLPIPDGPGLQWARRLVIGIGLVPALLAAIYKGVLYSTSSQPLWKDARWLGGYLTASTLVLGCAEMLLLATFLGSPEAVNMLRHALVVLLLLGSAPLAPFCWEVRKDLARMNRGKLSRAGLLSIGVGVLLPLCLLLAGSQVSLELCAALLVLVGGFVTRLEIVMAPHALS